MSELASQFQGDAVVANQTVNDAGVVVLGPLDVQAYGLVGFYVQNTSAPGTAIASGSIKTAPEVEGPWITAEVLNQMPIDGGDEVHYQFVDKSWKYIRMELTADVADLPVVNVWMSVGGAL